MANDDSLSKDYQMSVHVSKCKGWRCKGDTCYLATSCTLICLFECDTPHSVTLYWMSPCNLSLASRTEINTGHGASKTYRVTSGWHHLSSPPPSQTLISYFRDSFLPAQLPGSCCCSDAMLASIWTFLRPLLSRLHISLTQAQSQLQWSPIFQLDNNGTESGIPGPLGHKTGYFIPHLSQAGHVPCPVSPFNGGHNL